MRTRRTRTAGPPSRRRPLRAILGAFLYALCVLVLPALHLGFHRDDHDHAGGGLRLRFAVRGDRAHGPGPGPAHGHGHDHAAGHAHAVAVAPGGPLSAAALIAELFPRADARELAALLDRDARDARPGVAGGARAAGAGAAVRSGPASPHPAPASPASEAPHAGGSLAHFAAGLLPSAGVVFQPRAALLAQPPVPGAPAQLHAQRFLPAQGARGPPGSSTQRWV